MEWLAGKMEVIAGWAQTHPTLFATITTSLTTLAGIGIVGKLTGLTSAISTGTVSPAITGFFATLVSPAVVTTLTLLAGVLAALGIGKGLASMLEESTGVPIPEAAKQQVKRTQGTWEGYQLQSRYAQDPFGIGGTSGPERTARIDIESGELYTTRHMARDVVRNVAEDPEFQNLITGIIHNYNDKQIIYNAPAGVPK